MGDTEVGDKALAEYSEDVRRRVTDIANAELEKFKRTLAKRIEQIGNESGQSAEIIRALMCGESVASISGRLGVGRQWISKVSRDSGVTRARVNRADRDKAICESFKSGEAVTSIASRMSISTQTVDQVVVKNGLRGNKHEADRMGLRVAWHLGDRSLTLAEIARECGCTPQQVNYWRHRLISMCVKLKKLPNGVTGEGK